MRTLEKKSPGKVNLLLNILGKRPDGFHELETIFHSIRCFDELTLSRHGTGVQLTCNRVDLPTDRSNLIHRAATAFFAATRITDGVRIHLEKHLPLAAGLGGGSSNAAVTLAGLNELFDHPLAPDQLHALAATLGSDVNFFLQPQPALATGRGEKIEPLPGFPLLRAAAFFLVHPGFGVSTPWAYQALARFPDAQNGRPGRARRLIALLQAGDLAAAGREFYNSLEAPVLEKYPVLALYQEFFRAQGAQATLMSGSGSTTFALFSRLNQAEAMLEAFPAQFGRSGWLAAVPV
ncbi:MAG TPA: 4-(cytidine 5'-diphospho)-2-C-methyl-D-erythritol kinase [Verrucomicrobiota bacterium]|nr:4-(cytidine 5'-diphospho)-2-C-methyl-D-erythritol kinase [Verrucomicrobiota bacterium]HNT13253.1 4-(cytidine 5'-diphospho)-2-C-methyl-D-erythritol kinase [Verrucomicrobiota bacterium]